MSLGYPVRGPVGTQDVGSFSGVLKWDLVNILEIRVSVRRKKQKIKKDS